MTRVLCSLLLLLGLNLFSMHLHSQAIQLNLAEAQQYGIENNLAIKRTELDLATAREQVREALSIGYPQLNASVSYNNYLSLPATILPEEFFPEPVSEEERTVRFGTPQNLFANVELSQMIFDGSYIIGVKASKTFVELSEKRADLTEVDVRYNVEKAYYSALVAEQLIVFANQNIGNLRNLLDETKALYDNGFVEEIEVDRLELSLANMETYKANAEKQVELSYNLLKFQMGMDLDKEVELTDSLYGFLQSGNIMADVQGDYRNRPEYSVVEKQKAINEMNIKYFKYQHLPKLFLFGSYEQQAQRESFNFLESGQPWFEVALVGVELNIPIFDGFYRSSKVQQARIQLESIKLNELDLKQAVDIEVEQAKTSYLTATRELENQQKNLGLAEKIYNTAMIKYREGVGSSLEISDAERELFETQSNYVEAVYNVLIARSDLKKALGNY